MKLADIYRICVELGMAEDPRDRAELDRVLGEARTAFDKLDEDDRPFFDQERLKNPYADTRIVAGDPDLKVSSLICGIDMEVAEVLLADRLRERGTPIDLILAHHPEGPGFANLDEVMGMQADVWHRQGVPIGTADALISVRAAEVRRKIMPANHYRAVDAAGQLGFAMMSCHTPADNCVNGFVQRFVDAEAPGTLEALVKVLRRIPEYAEGARRGCGPELILGDGKQRAGRVMVDMTGGTEGPLEALDRLSAAGVDTIVGMHFSEEHRKRAEERKLALVIAGHIASDTLGMNLVLDSIEREGVEILCTSGMVRVSRV